MIPRFLRRPLLALALCFAATLPSHAQTSDVDARKTLEAAILADSAGSITLKRFATLEEKRGDEDGRAFLRAQYKAELEFRTSGVWQFYPPSGKLSFRISVPPDFNRASGGNVARMVAESKWYEQNTGASVKRGDRSTISGVLVFAKSDSGWRLVKNQFDILGESDPWMLPAEPDTSAGLAASSLTPKQAEAIKTNLRQLCSAADQYYLENGVKSTTYDKLVGPDKYLKWVKPVAGEDYTAIRFEYGKPLIVATPSGEMVTYGGFE